MERNWRETVEKLERTCGELVENLERTWRETFCFIFSSFSVSRKNIDALGINYTVSRENKTANHVDFVRISVRYQKTVDIELVVRMEDTTSNRRLGSLNFNLSLSLSHAMGR